MSSILNNVKMALNYHPVCSQDVVLYHSVSWNCLFHPFESYFSSGMFMEMPPYRFSSCMVQWKLPCVPGLYTVSQLFAHVG